MMINPVRPLFIKTPRLTLHSIRESDKIEMMKLASDKDIKKTYMLPDFKNLEEKETFFYRIKAISENLDRFVYGIYLEGRIIGFINEVSKKEETIEIGYFINPLCWNQGYATEALKAAIKELFNMGYLHVEASHFKENPASGRVMEKAGMHKVDEKGIIEYRDKKHELINYIIDK